MNYPRTIVLAIFLAMLVTPLHAQASETDVNDMQLGESGLPLPRFASLKFPEVNTRNGPGKRYPIRWVYKQKTLPVEIVEEFEDWRRIIDPVGDGGWVHMSQLSGVRSYTIRHTAVLREEDNLNAKPLIRISKDVMGRIIECQPNWCRLQVENYKGWLPKEDLWGVYPKEVIED